MRPRYVSYVNSLDAWVPEVWAAETLIILEENMVMGNLVYRDFENEIADFGDTVNTRKPAEFTAERKTANDDVTIQNAEATNIPVTLDQHIHTSFMIRDSEGSLSFQDLVNQYLTPAAMSLARQVDRVLTGQVYQFLDNAQGTLGDMASTDIKNRILATRKKMNINNLPMDGRNLVITPNTEEIALQLDTFITADKVGDEGTALREASLGRKLGFDIFMAQNTPGISGSVSTLLADYLNADAAKGATALTMDAGALLNGQYFTLEGDEQPLRVASGGGTANIVSNRALRAAVAAGASNVYQYAGNTVDLAGHTGVTAYPIGYSKRIKVDDADATGAVPQVGQLVAFTDTTRATVRSGEYSITQVIVDGSDYYIVLDRPLEAALADNDKADFGPNGEYNFAFRRDAIGLVTRPLAIPKEGTGALSAVSNYNNLAVRVVITYNGTKQGHLVTLDLLAGVAVLESAAGVPMLG